MEQNIKELEYTIKEEKDIPKQEADEAENKDQGFLFSNIFNYFIEEYGLGGIFTLISSFVIAIAFPFEYIIIYKVYDGFWAFTVTVATTIIGTILSPLSTYLAMLGWRLGSLYNFIGGVFGWWIGLIAIEVFLVSFTEKLL